VLRRHDGYFVLHRASAEDEAEPQTAACHLVTPGTRNTERGA
jgi:hypothetical protein